MIGTHPSEQDGLRFIRGVPSLATAVHIQIIEITVQALFRAQEIAHVDRPTAAVNPVSPPRLLVTHSVWRFFHHAGTISSSTRATLCGRHSHITGLRLGNSHLILSQLVAAVRKLSAHSAREILSAFGADVADGVIALDHPEASGGSLAAFTSVDALME